MNIEPSIQTLVDNATLRRVGSEGGTHEFSIDAMRHKEQTGFGQQAITYTLRIDDSAEEGDRFEIEEQSEMQGGDVKLATDDPNEVVAWIEENRP
jgi:hypothetical protein